MCDRVLLDVCINCLVMPIYQLERKVNRLENLISVLMTVDCTANSPLRLRLTELE